ncbi:hypothetical protein BRARA_I01491 [Brassica rapa]|uniref:Uncharacterized protein n=1 Tax=Brassica campestris TaxID=3711 RepID=A0A397XZ37_BRACM|nr:hypothetical protein BRARA_I01491 [Brassica rapa]CAG7861336.1 unnamed protein product [Brassica rapa]VDC59695.1 unnamed protein product [Brassica rapa]
MSKKRNPLEDPPAASSSDEEEVESSAEEEEEEDDNSSSEEEDDDPKPPPPSSSAVTIAVPGKPTASLPAADSESGSETETDSESEPEQPTNKGSCKAILTAKKSNDAPPPPPVALALPAKSGSKRPSTEGSSKETNSKRVKKDEEKREDSKKPAAFQRLWTEEDEIAVLQGMIDFKNDTGKSPYDDTNVYYDYIKKSISFEVSKNQFMDKIRSLRKKYIGKEKPSFTKPHDQKSYRLCQYIWGPDGMGLESAVKSNGASKKSQKKTKKLDSVKQELSFGASPNGKTVDDDENDVEVAVAAKKHDWFENSFLVKGIAGFGVDEHYVKQRWSLVPVETKKKVEEKLKLLQAKEIEFVLQKTEVLHEVTTMIAEASKNKPLDI